MEDFFDVKTVDEARKILLTSLFDAAGLSRPAPRREEVDLLSALGRVLAEDVVSPEDVPPYPRSTVDGYAVRAADTFGATEALPGLLTLLEDIPMGSLPSSALSPGQCSRIPTGGVLPPGADSCVMVEHTEMLDERTVLVRRPVATGENVVQRGEDMGAGEIVLRAGRILTPFDLGALAALGLPKVPVVLRPVVAVISSGDEIVPPGAAPLPGQVRDINSYSLGASLSALGAKPVLFGIARDTYDSLREMVETALGTADAVVLSGGSSVGARDLAVAVLNDLGPPGVLVHGVAVKPGKPVVLAICRGKPVFGLPGHPVSALVALDLFVRYTLNAMVGSIASHPDTLPRLASAQEAFVTARLARNLSSSPGREDHVRVRLTEKDGVLHAEPILGKSAILSTMVGSDGEVVIPLESEGLVAGSTVRVRLPRF
ncbi:MAG: gephyrin-like molybdotransferase Glp [Bacillota bacterium]